MDPTLNLLLRRYTIQMIQSQLSIARQWPGFREYEDHIVALLLTHTKGPISLSDLRDVYERAVQERRIH